MMIEGSGARFGSVPHTNGSGSGSRSRSRIRIQIRNIDDMKKQLKSLLKTRSRASCLTGAAAWMRRMTASSTFLLIKVRCRYSTTYNWRMDVLSKGLPLEMKMTKGMKETAEKEGWGKIQPPPPPLSHHHIFADLCSNV
jgi:hypothetical protein